MTLLDDVRWLPGSQRLLAEARAEAPQKDSLCGPFAGLVALRAADIPVLDQDEVAAAAGTVRYHDPAEVLPPGEAGRSDFRLRLPSTADQAEAGTTAVALAHAIERLADHGLRVVPASGTWKTPCLRGVLDGLSCLDRVAVIANVDTGAFAAPDTPLRALRDYLDVGMPPMWRSRWRVGHFVLLAGQIHGEEGELVSIVDTYPSLGDRGMHLQPIELVTAALTREDEAPGGLLLVVDARDTRIADKVIADAGLRADFWDHPPARFY